MPFSLAGSLFQARGPTTENAQLPETSLVLGTARSFQLADQSEARPGTSSIEMTNLLRLGACPMIMRWLSKHSLNSVWYLVSNQQSWQKSSIHVISVFKAQKMSSDGVEYSVQCCTSRPEQHYSILNYSKTTRKHTVYRRFGFTSEAFFRTDFRCRSSVCKSLSHTWLSW